MKKISKIISHYGHKYSDQPKMSKSFPVIFFGSGPVAAESYKLLKSSFNFEAIITKPSTISEMKLIAGSTSVYSVANKLELDQLIETSQFKSHVGILIDFGIIVSGKVIDSFPKGIINSHFSLLPQWRGADPITFSILSGQSTTGVSLMILAPGMDEGPLISIAELEIEADDDSISLTRKLIDLSDVLLKDALPRYLAGEIHIMDQLEAAQMTGSSQEITYSRKLSKADGKLDWTKPAEVLEREIRAYSSWPKSYCNLNGLDLIIKKAKVVKLSGKPGDYNLTQNSLIVYCGKDALQITSLQPSGKKEMPIEAFLLGYSSKL